MFVHFCPNFIHCPALLLLSLQIVSHLQSSTYKHVMIFDISQLSLPFSFTALYLAPFIRLSFTFTSQVLHSYSRVLSCHISFLCSPFPSSPLVIMARPVTTKKPPVPKFTKDSSVPVPSTKKTAAQVQGKTPGQNVPRQPIHRLVRE